MSSIAQMTIGTVPPTTTTSVSHPVTATATTSSAVVAGGQPGAQTGLADATFSATQSAAQLAAGNPYATPLPPPGFPYLPAGYPPYWGMYPYPYPPYVPSMPALSLGGTLATVKAITPDPGQGSDPSSTPIEPIPDAPEVRPETPQPPREDPEWPDDMYADMPPLEGRESDEYCEIEAQGTVCAIAPIQKRGRDAVEGSATVPPEDPESKQ